MYKLFFIFIVMILFGCNNGQKEIQLQQQNDSLKVVLSRDTLLINSLVVQVDSLKDASREQKLFIKMTALQCHKYATYVKNNPNNSVFIVAWIDRAFLGMDTIGIK